MKAGLEAYEKLGWSAVTHMLSLAPYLADYRLLEIVRAMFNHATMRISQTEFKSVPPRSNPSEWRGFHSDWPHDLTDRSRCGRVNQPFLDIVVSITSIWMLSPFTHENGATWVVPRSHRDPRNPRGENDGIDEFCTIPGELQVCGEAGDVILIDSRIWHSTGANLTDEIRTSIVARYSPWWLSVEYGKRNAAFVPAHIFLTACPSRFRPCTPIGGRKVGPYSLFHCSQADGVGSLAPVERRQLGIGLEAIYNREETGFQHFEKIRSRDESLRKQEFESSVPLDDV